MLVKTQAVVLSSIKYRDADLIVKCYTKSFGIVSFMVRGVLKSKKGKFRVSQFQALSLIDIEFQYRKKGQLEYLKDVQISNHLNTIQSNVYKSSLVMFLSEVLKSVIVEEEQNENLFNFINHSILHLEKSTDYANFHLMFLIHLTSYLGFFPHHPEQERDNYFNLNEGIFEAYESSYTMSLENSNLLKIFIENDIVASQNINMNKHQRLNFLKLLMSYYELHIENFKRPKSLAVIESIFS